MIQQVLFSMRGINYMAAFGTILIFISIYSFKATFYKRVYKEETSRPGAGVKNSNKVLLVMLSIICMAVGIFLILRALKVI
jgi:formate hydrogenlyase subunit 3/multisubunit Na+/H+ antiporter MnhD subunit